MMKDVSKSRNVVVETRIEHCAMDWFRRLEIYESLNTVGKLLLGSHIDLIIRNWSVRACFSVVGVRGSSFLIQCLVRIKKLIPFFSFYDHLVNIFVKQIKYSINHLSLLAARIAVNLIQPTFIF